MRIVIDYEEVARNFDERYRLQPFKGVEARLRSFAKRAGIQRVLEVGCGTGHWLKTIADLNINSQVLNVRLQCCRRRVSVESELTCCAALLKPYLRTRTILT